MKKLLLVLIFAINSVLYGAEPTELQKTGVTIYAGGSQGSGSLITRERDGKKITFVLTCGHVVDELRTVRKVIDPKTKYVRNYVQFKDATVYLEVVQNGRAVGDQRYDAEVVLYSDAETDQDLALLRVRLTDFTNQNISIHEGDIPKVGTKVYHVGTPSNRHHVVTAGTVSRLGTKFHLKMAKQVEFDTATLAFQGGSSGGAIFDAETSKYIGMLVRGDDDNQFSYFVPARRIIAWAEEAGVPWLIDESLPLPSDKQLAKLPIELKGNP